MKLRVLAGLHRADIGFIDIGLDLHAAQVLGQREEHRRLQRGGDGLAGLDAALEHDAVDRRQDARFGDFDLLEMYVRLGDRDVSLGRCHRGDGAVARGARIIEDPARGEKPFLRKEAWRS